MPEPMTDVGTLLPLSTGSVFRHSPTSVPSLVTDFLFLPDERMLVSTKDGRVLVVKANLVSNIAADLSALVGTHYGDRGLVRMISHPDFGKGNGKDFIYIAYVYDPTVAEADQYFGGLKPDLGENLASASGPKLDRLSRFEMQGDTLVASSEKILIGNCQFRQGVWWGDDVGNRAERPHDGDAILFSHKMTEHSTPSQLQII